MGRLAAEHRATLYGIVRPHLATIQRLDFPQLAASAPTSQTPLLVVNARLVPSVTAYRGLSRLMDSAKTVAVYDNHSLAAAMIGPGGPAPPGDENIEHWTKYVANSITGKTPEADLRLPLFEYPHDVVRQNLTIVQENLLERLSCDRYREIADGVFARQGASLGQYCVTDTTKGPLLLDEGAVVGPY